MNESHHAHIYYSFLPGAKSEGQNPHTGESAGGRGGEGHRRVDSTLEEGSHEEDPGKYAAPQYMKDQYCPE